MNRNITAAILIAIAVGVYFTVTSKMIDDAKTVKALNDRYTAALDDAARLVETRDRVLEQYNAISLEDRDRLDKMIPSSVDNIRLIIDMNNIARNYGFPLSNVTATAVPSDAVVDAYAVSSEAGLQGVSVPVLDTVEVSFKATAPYNQFVSFLQGLETNLRIMDLTHLSVVAEEGGLYDFEVELQTYWVRQ